MTRLSCLFALSVLWECDEMSRMLFIFGFVYNMAINIEHENEKELKTRNFNTNAKNRKINVST